MTWDDKSGVPVDRGWAWMIVLAYFISVFCMVGIAKSFGIFLEEFVAYFDIPVALAALIMGVSGGVYTISAPICVAAGQHFSQRRVVMLGGLVGGVGLCLSGLLFNIEWVIITFGALYGFGNACVFGNGLVMLGQYFSKYRSLANGLALSGASIGQFVLPPLLQLLLDTYSLKGTLIIIGGLYFNVIMCGTLYRPISFYMKPTKAHTTGEDQKLIDDKPKPKPDHPAPHHNDDDDSDANMKGDGDLKDLEDEDEQKGEVRHRMVSNGSMVLGSVDSLHTLAVDTSPTTETQEKSLCKKLIDFFKNMLDFTVLRSNVVIMFVIMSFLMFFGHFNFVLFMPAAASNRGISKYEKAWLVSINGISDLFGRILIGVAGDLKIIERYKLMSISTFFCGVSIVCFSIPDEFWVMALFVVMYGFTGGCYVAINVPTLIDLVGLASMPKVLGVVLFIQGLGAAIGQPVLDLVGLASMPKVLGVVLFIQGLGAAIGQPVLGKIRDEMGTYQLVHYINATSIIAGSILLATYPLIKKSEERRQSNIPKQGTVLELKV